MFTGLIEATGTIHGVERRSGLCRIAVSAPDLALRTGDSIAVSGVCLTAIEILRQGGALTFYADLAAETVSRTSLADLPPGSMVNLELPTPAGAPLGGHIVQGHVDGTGEVIGLEPLHAAASPEATDWRLRVSVPAEIGAYVVEKGSIAIEGISLTVARWEPGAAGGGVAQIAIIPHTYAHTNLRALAPGAKVNLEADVAMKFLERRGPKAGFELTLEYLIANGY